MTSSEAARKHWKELKGKPFKQKVEHIVTYYGVVLLMLLAVVIFAVSYTVHLLTLKDTALNITCLGSALSQTKADEYAAGFAQHVGIDTEKYEVDVATNLSSYAQSGSDGAYEAAEVMIAMAVAQKVDAVVSDRTTLIPYMYQRLFADLSEVLSAEQQERYKDCFLYADQTLVEQLRDMTVIDEVPEFPDPTKPELMDKPIPIALCIPQDTEFHQKFFPTLKEDAVYGIIINSVNLDYTLAFLDYIMECS